MSKKIGKTRYLISYRELSTIVALLSYYAAVIYNIGIWPVIYHDHLSIKRKG